MAERSFKARLERRLALLLEEGLQESSRRRWKRATAVGNNSLQVNTSDKYIQVYTYHIWRSDVMTLEIIRELHTCLVCIRCDCDM